MKVPPTVALLGILLMLTEPAALPTVNAVLLVASLTVCVLVFDEVKTARTLYAVVLAFRPCV